MAGTTASSSIVARGSAAAGGAAFLAAGGLTVAASWARWGDSCGRGFDSAACVNAQDHRSDVLATGNPWDPIGNSAVLAGAGYVSLALGLALVLAVLPSPSWARAIQAMLVGSVLGLGVITLLSLPAGESIGFEWLGVPWWLSPLFLSSVLVGAVMQGGIDAVMPSWAWAAWAGLLILANPIIEYVLTTMVVGYDPFDSTPWEGMISGGAFVAAGLVVLGASARSAARRRLPAQR